MPNYTFTCLQCDTEFEKFFLTTDYERASRLNFRNETCPICGAEKVKRLYRLPTVTYKGKGFYNTDNKPTKMEQGHTWD